MHTPRRAALAALATISLAAAAPPAPAADFKAGTLTIEQPWARATPSGAQVGGGYMIIRNGGAAPDRLVGGSLEASAGFELHAMSMDAGVMKMRPAGPLEIPAGGAVTLAPAGQHIMFKGLKRGLKKGEAIGGTLTFEHAGTVPVTFDIKGIGARTPTDPAPAMPGMDMN